MQEDLFYLPPKKESTGYISSRLFITQTIDADFDFLCSQYERVAWILPMIVSVSLLPHL